MSNITNYENLANAIILQAVKDYRMALKCLKRNPKNRPFMQAMMSGMPAVPYIPPCSFQQKHPGTVLRYFMIAFTMSDSFICQTNLPVYNASDTFDTTNPIFI